MQSLPTEENVLSQEFIIKSRGVLSSTLYIVCFFYFLDMSHFSEADGKCENKGQKAGVCVERSIEDLQKSLLEMKASGDFSKGSLSPVQVQRPHSPVAEFLDHLEFEPLERSQVILEKQVDALSDLESSKSSQELEASDKENILILIMPTTDSLQSDQQSSRSHFSAEQSDEEVDLDLQHEGIHLITSPGIPIISKYFSRHVLRSWSIMHMHLFQFSHQMQGSFSTFS